jgi:hypothetical protein
MAGAKMMGDGLVYMEGVRLAMVRAGLLEE